MTNMGADNSKNENTIQYTTHLGHHIQSSPTRVIEEFHGGWHKIVLIL